MAWAAAALADHHPQSIQRVTAIEPRIDRFQIEIDSEAIRLIRALWTEERVDFQGEYYTTERASIYDRPEQPVPIYVAASGPLAAKLAGRVGDGFICTSGKDPALYDELLAKVVEGAEAAGRDPAQIRHMIEIKVSYDRDPERVITTTHPWAALALKP